MEQGPASFTRRARLTRPAQFRRVFTVAVRSASRNLTLLTAPNGLGYPRLGLAISKKAAARAVVRNTIKRIIRETFRHKLADMGGWDIVVMAKAPAATASRIALRAELEEHWNRLIQRPCAPSLP